MRRVLLFKFISNSLKQFVYLILDKDIGIVSQTQSKGCGLETIVLVLGLILTLQIENVVLILTFILFSCSGSWTDPSLWSCL